MMSIDHTIGNLLAIVLNSCAQRMGVTSSQVVVNNLHHGDASTCRVFYRGLAQEVAQFLGTLDEDIKAVYLFDYASAVECAPLDMFNSIVPIHLIVWTRRKTAALYAFIAAIDRALVQGINVLCQDCQVTRFLDTQFIDDADVKDRAGYGTLPFSIGLAATQVWRRNETPGQSTPTTQPTSPLS